MKVLSIKEPYASLIKDGYKCYETRSFKTNYRGELYIHASLSKCNQSDKLSKLITPMYGEIICKCMLVDCIYMIMKWNINADYMKSEDMLGFWKMF